MYNLKKSIETFISSLKYNYIIIGSDHIKIYFWFYTTDYWNRFKYYVYYNDQINAIEIYIRERMKLKNQNTIQERSMT